MRLPAFSRPKRMLLAAGVLLVTCIVVALAAGAVATQRIAREAERVAPPSGRFLDIDGSRFHYVDDGQGPPILFLHGLSGSLLHFTEPLFGKLSGFRLVAVDRAGSGYSARGEGGGPGIRAQAEEISRLIARLELGRALVVGHSFGGAVALQLALDHPEQVAGLALLAPLARPTDRLLGEFKYLIIRPALLRDLAAFTVAVPYAARGYARGLRQTFGPQAAPPGYAAAGGRLVLRPAAIRTASAEAVALVDGPDLAAMQPRLPALAAMPVGVLFGEKDQILHEVAETRALRRALPALTVQVLPGVGHMVQFSEPDETAGFIRSMARRAFAAPAQAESAQ